MWRVQGRSDKFDIVYRPCEKNRLVHIETDRGERNGGLQFRPKFTFALVQRKIESIEASAGWSNKRKFNHSERDPRPQR